MGLRRVLTHLLCCNHTDLPPPQTFAAKAPGASPRLASHAWVEPPIEGSLLVFPGNLLHGVLPDGGSTGDDRECSGRRGDVGDDDDNEGFRTTLMIAWWEAGLGPEITSTDTSSSFSGDSASGIGCASRMEGLTVGPSMRAPRSVTRCCHGAPEGSSSSPSWPRYFSAAEEDKSMFSREASGPDGKPSCRPARLVAPAWQSIINMESHHKTHPGLSSQIKGGSSSLCPLADMRLPLDTLRFFIRSEDEFDSLYLRPLSDDTGLMLLGGNEGPDNIISRSSASSEIAQTYSIGNAGQYF